MINSIFKLITFVTTAVHTFSRVAPDTKLAGYPIFYFYSMKVVDTVIHFFLSARETWPCVSPPPLSDVDTG